MQRPPSPTKYSSQATDSPSKLNLPSRKQRNQTASHVHDIKFITDISTSLLAQLRHLQTILADREESLKGVNLEKSRLEIEAEGFAQRLKSLDESEQRYKDENWSLETQTHELLAAAKEAASREQRLQQSLAVATSDKTAAQRELDDLKQANGKLAEDHAAARKAQESELAGLRKDVSFFETERGLLQRRVEELASQNQELAKAVAGRFAHENVEPTRELDPESEDVPVDHSDPEHSPPPSPSKATSRHSMLESETLKSSLHHAHRMIQSLKSNIHREKTEKVELKRMLQEARDELEVRRSSLGTADSGSKRAKARPQQDFGKKAFRPGVLGAGRNSRTDIMLDEAEWEDHNGDDSPSRAAATRSHGINRGLVDGKLTDMSDAYQTANDSEDAFETANERDNPTEDENFQTGAESMAGDSSDEKTETEGATTRSGTVRGRRALPHRTTESVNRSSFISTGSTSADEDDGDVNHQDVRTPLQAHPQRYRLRMNRGSRRSQIGGEGTPSSNPSSDKNSPASFVSNGAQGGQSLYAELGDMDGDDSGEEVDGTPSRASIISQRSSPGARFSTYTVVAADFPPVPKAAMIDSGMMTERWEALPSHGGSNVAGTLEHDVVSLGNMPAPVPATPQTRDVGVQRTPASGFRVASDPSNTPSPLRPIWDQPLANFASQIPTFGPALTSTPMSTRSAASQDVAHETSPRALTEQSPPRVLSFSSIQTLETAPVEPAPLSPPRQTQRSYGTTSGDTTALVESENQLSAALKGGILGSVFGWNKTQSPEPPRIAEDDTTQESPVIPAATSDRERMSFSKVPGNIAQGELDRPDQSYFPADPVFVDTTDQSSQTLLSSEEIENILRHREQKSLIPVPQDGKESAKGPSLKPLSDIGASAPPPQRTRSHDNAPSLGRAQGSMAEAAVLSREAIPLKSSKRQGSLNSIRAAAASASAPGTYPPLPPDHRQAIAAAAQKAPSAEAAPVVMGPPLVPASAYRQPAYRPRTPTEQRTPTSASKQGSTTPRPRYSAQRNQMSRRSSFSSFASELDERFNIRTDGMPMIPHGLEGGTDPRMIQAITQTMIGEYLWKYTRKPGRGEMSDNRHRRFFWVHPYTRTLYWSDRDPATAGRAELKAKSVAIEAVRVVTDDNPMPPGLHRKSLVIITPGRAVKFTATTGQRHETWFNALSYLLLRTGPETAGVSGANDITTEDVEEFNPSSGTRFSRTGGSRVSLSSYNSRTTRGHSPQPRNQSSFSTRLPTGAPVDRAPGQSSTASRNPQLSRKEQGGSMSSRLSNYWRSGKAGRASMSSRRSTQQERGGDGSIYNASVVHDSAEDVRQVISQQERGADQLENVRACCDGKSFKISGSTLTCCLGVHPLTTLASDREA